jgi:dienelactone hydrolase
MKSEVESMTLLSRTRIALAIGLSLVVLPALGGYARAQDKKDGDKPEKKAVSFRSVDGVELKGTYWSSTKGNKNACVLFLHNFSRKSGGNRNDDGWNDLAEDLAKEGYNVLSFDFRGHGESTTVGKEFWNKQLFPHNLVLLKGTVKADMLPTKIDYKDFTQSTGYYPHLVDDIAAAKAYLDGNAGKSAGNLVIVGAGEGATLGALWMTAELRRYREKTENGMGPTLLNNFETEPEGRDIACAIWLSLSPSVDNRAMLYDTWLEEVGSSKKNKVPMLFVYGKDEPANGTAIRTARAALQKISPGYKLLGSDKGENKDAAIKFTRDYAVDTKLEGSQMLQGQLNTGSVVKGWMNKVIEDRGNKETKRHDSEKYRYVWVSQLNLRMPRLAKQAGEEFMFPIPVNDPGIR